MIRETRASRPSHPFDRVIPFIRLSGLALLALGLAIGLGWLSILPAEIGFVIAVVGLLEMLLIPAILRRLIRKKKDDFLIGNRPDDRADIRH